jgi:predicted nucleic acid-binding protein
MYLVDTNVWLERLLEQEKSEDVRRFLNVVPAEQLFITDFSFHSIGVVLTRLNRSEALTQFVKDAFIDGAVNLVHLKPIDTQRIVDSMREFNLDFDDAYQYAAADQYGLVIVSLDADFDHTEKGRRTPDTIDK